MVMRVYVDSCIPSELFNGKKCNSEEDLEGIGLLADRQDIEFVTSPKMLQEIMAASSDKRNVLKLFYRLLDKPLTRDPSYFNGLIGAAPLGTVPLGGGNTIKQPVFAKLEELFEVADAEHIFYAHEGKCDYFLTVDYRSILNKVPTLLDKLDKLGLKLKFVSPADLIKQLSG